MLTKITVERTSFKTSVETTRLQGREMSLSEKLPQGEAMKIRAHVFVGGRVQGVFYRSEARYEARKHHVNGWIRNLPDDRVEAVFEGEEQDVKQLVEFCKRGPPTARVAAIEVSWEPYTGEFNDFEIRY
jgi:acylphosphatase